MTVRDGAGSSAGPWSRSRYTAGGDATVLSPATKARVSDASEDLVDVDDVVETRLGPDVRLGEAGELCIRGYSVMRGHCNDEERTRESIVGGWMHSGDLASLDEAGFCRIVGRVKDMIIRGGENVYPREVEDYLFRHPAIREAQVFGIPDAKYGEQVCAWVAPHEGAALKPEDVIGFCAGQIAHFKVPKHVRIVDELPMTVTGKPQKFVMREWMVREGYAGRRAECLKPIELDASQCGVCACSRRRSSKARMSRRPSAITST